MVVFGGELGGAVEEFAGGFTVRGLLGHWEVYGGFGYELCGEAEVAGGGVRREVLQAVGDEPGGAGEVWGLLKFFVFF